jgi:hypothetical protein
VVAYVELVLIKDGQRRGSWKLGRAVRKAKEPCVPGIQEVTLTRVSVGMQGDSKGATEKTQGNRTREIQGDVKAREDILRIMRWEEK